MMLDMFEVVETHFYLSRSDNLLSDDERSSFVDWISENYDSGDIIPGSGGVRKLRWRRAGMGKRSGLRIIFYTYMSGGRVYLLSRQSRNVR
ncbi:hypothetical protein FACS1894116_00900 [Betaproteobacteria bacterium]|nr:hypothetical protein FACS1894116_00900 [Betaproteobacteria bacterium]GHU24004.1 hypothetical protein FACS189488_07730 [Betaproteobacteria bacterium]GHU31350.1 hypothetical protein FACS189497_12080 [Betaproteobacteria bacterium]